MVDPAMATGIQVAEALEKAAAGAPGPPIGGTELEAGDLSNEAPSYLTQATGGPIGEVWAELGAAVRFRRFKRALKRAEGAAAILQQRGRKQARPVPDDVFFPLLEAATLTDDETLAEKWAALMANAMDPAAIPVRPNFANILGHLTATDVQVLDYIASLGNNRPGLGIGWIKTSRQAIELQGPIRDRDAVRLSVDSILRERLLVEIEQRRPPQMDPRTNRLRDQPPRGWELRFGSLGVAFVDACRTQPTAEAGE
ncbi:MAG: Abi-alpha family protein [Solirubrobacteraceae bacterium]